MATKQVDQVVDGADDEIYSIFEELQDPAIYTRLSGGMQAAALGIVKATLADRVENEPEQEADPDRE